MEFETIYDFVQKMEPIQIFYYFLITVVILFTFQFIPITLSHITALILAGVVMLYLNKKDDREQLSKMKELAIKLNNIHPRPRWFYIDSDVIEIVDDIKEYGQYNIVAFSNMIYAIDNFLELVNDMELGVEDVEDNIDVALHQKRIAIDNLQAILFKLEVNRALEYKLEQAIYSLRLVLQRHVDKMLHRQEKRIAQNGYDNRTRVYYFDHPKGLDNEKNREYINIS